MEHETLSLASDSGAMKLRSTRILAVLLALLTCAAESSLAQQVVRRSISYTIRVDSRDLSGFVMRDGAPTRIAVPITGYDRPTVRVDEIADASPEQRSLREQWLIAEDIKH